MNRTELTRKLSEHTGMPQRTVEVLVGRLFHLVVAELGAGRDVTIPGFGTLAVKTRARRTGRNPRTGEPLEIPPSRTVTFRPSKAVRDVVND